MARTRNSVAVLGLLLGLIAGAGCRRTAPSQKAAHPQAAKQAAAPAARADGPVLDRWLAQLACPVPLRSDPADQVTCDACPAGSDFAPRADDPASAHEGWWTLDGTAFGHFTAPAAEEAVLHAQGCESHADGLGGAFLLRREAEHWRVVRYVHAMPGRDCQALRMGSGRDALLCRSDDMHQGIIENAVGLAMIGEDPAQNQGSGEDSVLLYTTDETEVCADSRVGFLTVHVGDVTGVDLLPPGLNGLQDVRLRVKLGMARYTKRHNDDELCPLISSKEYEVMFRNGGDHLQADTGAAAVRELVPRYDHTLHLAGRVVPAAF